MFTKQACIYYDTNLLCTCYGEGIIVGINKLKLFINMNLD